MLTAISVARQCGMISPTQEVYIAHAYPPGQSGSFVNCNNPSYASRNESTSSTNLIDQSSLSPACIQWEQANIEEAKVAKAGNRRDSGRVRPLRYTIGLFQLIQYYYFKVSGYS